MYERAAGGARTQAIVRDASLGGVFIETPTPLEPGALVSIEFSSGSGFKVQVEGRVISVQKSDAGDHKAGMAVRFLDLPDGAASTLGPMFQASRPPARTYLGVGATEPEIPKAPSVPKLGPNLPPPPPFVAPAPPEPPPPPFVAPAAPMQVAPMPMNPGLPASVPPPSFAPPQPMAPVAMAMPARRTSPLVWVLVVFAILFVLLFAAGVAGFLLFRAHATPVPPSVTTQQR
jgi:hypothetical protein